MLTILTFWFSNNFRMAGEVTLEEMACIYSAAILADDDVPVTQEKLSTILKAANVEVSNDTVIKLGMGQTKSEPKMNI